MGTTTAGYPYPEGTDFVVDGDDAIKALAQSVQDHGFIAAASGYSTFPAVPAGESKSTTVTFPSGRFTRAPQMAEPTGNPRVSFLVASIAATSVILTGFNYTQVDATERVMRWIALQATPGASLQAEPLEAESDAVVTCPTEGCENQGIPIEIASTWTDDDGESHTVDAVECGVCGADITATLTPIGG